jgi:hypothetical protein
MMEKLRRLHIHETLDVLDESFAYQYVIRVPGGLLYCLVKYHGGTHQEFRPYTDFYEKD